MYVHQSDYYAFTKAALSTYAEMAGVHCLTYLLWTVENWNERLQLNPLYSITLWARLLGDRATHTSGRWGLLGELQLREPMNERSGDRQRLEYQWASPVNVSNPGFPRRSFIPLSFSHLSLLPLLDRHPLGLSILLLFVSLICFADSTAIWSGFDQCIHE